MMRHCQPGNHDVPEREAQVLRATITGSGPGVPVWACHQHIREKGLVPAAAFIGRRDTPPILTARRPA
jgi:hypothetical protein